MIWLLNLIIPGSGLIFRRREWLGMCMALVFAIGFNVAVAGFVIAPEAVPYWLTQTAIWLAILAWIFAQYRYYREGVILARTRHGLEHLLSSAEAALEANDLELARRELRSAAALDDESIRLHVLRARVSKLEENESEMRDAWHRVIKLDRSGKWRAQAERALADASSHEGRATPEGR